jgi:hypothetical protein
MAVEKFLRVVSHQPGFTLAVANLLAPISAHGLAVVMPDERGRRKSQLPVSRLQPPAHIDVVPSPEVNGIEAADFEKRVTAERHIATRNVLGDSIVEKHMGWPAGSSSDALRDEWVVGWNHIRATGANDVRRDHWLDEKRQPVAIDPSVGIGVGDDFPGRLGQPHVSRRAQPAVRYVDDTNTRVAVRDFAGSVFRAVVDDDHLEVGICELLEG